jgi:hypothetical protein
MGGFGRSRGFELRSSPGKTGMPVEAQIYALSVS